MSDSEKDTVRQISEMISDLDCDTDLFHSAANTHIVKPIHVWIDEWVLESLKERDREITLRKKLYGKPTRKSRKRKF